MKNILCFGDSNTFGSNPDNGQRHPYDIRWTGRLEKALPDCHIIEEGLGGRTTVFDDPLHPNRKGIDALDLILDSHKPIDLAIIMLGTNDCKYIYNCDAKVTAMGIAAIVDRIRRFPFPDWTRAPEILVISPILIEEGAWLGFPTFDERSVEKSKGFAREIGRIAEMCKVHFLDASLYAGPGSDHLHMDADGHRKLALAIEEKVRQIIGL